MNAATSNALKFLCCGLALVALPPDTGFAGDVVVYAPICEPSDEPQPLINPTVSPKEPKSPASVEKLKTAYISDGGPRQRYCRYKILKTTDWGMQTQDATNRCKADYDAEAKKPDGLLAVCPSHLTPVSAQNAQQIYGTHDYIRNSPDIMCYALCADHSVANITQLEAGLAQQRRDYDTLASRLEALTKEVHEGPKTSTVTDTSRGGSRQ